MPIERLAGNNSAPPEGKVFLPRVQIDYITQRDIRSLHRGIDGGTASDIHHILHVGLRDTDELGRARIGDIQLGKGETCSSEHDTSFLGCRHIIAEKYICPLDIEDSAWYLIANAVAFLIVKCQFVVHQAVGSSHHGLMVAVYGVYLTLQRIDADYLRQDASLHAGRSLVHDYLAVAGCHTSGNGAVVPAGGMTVAAVCRPVPVNGHTVDGYTQGRGEGTCITIVAKVGIASRNYRKVVVGRVVQYLCRCL